MQPVKRLIDRLPSRFCAMAMAMTLRVAVQSVLFSLPTASANRRGSRVDTLHTLVRRVAFAMLCTCSWLGCWPLSDPRAGATVSPDIRMAQTVQCRTGLAINSRLLLGLLIGALRSALK